MFRKTSERFTRRCFDVRPFPPFCPSPVSCFSTVTWLAHSGCPLLRLLLGGVGRENSATPTPQLWRRVLHHEQTLGQSVFKRLGRDFGTDPLCWTIQFSRKPSREKQTCESGEAAAIWSSRHCKPTACILGPTGANMRLSLICGFP